MDNELLNSFFKKLATYGNSLSHEKNIEAYYHYEQDSGKFNISWEIGRDSGGSCYGGEAQYEHTRHKEPEFEILDFLLLE